MLKNDEKKHFNYDGLRIFQTGVGAYYGLAIGNDDKRIQGININFWLISGWIFHLISYMYVNFCY